MDQYIRQSIDARKNAFSASFEIGTEMQKKIDTLFKEIEKLGAECKDVGDFEAKFAASPLNQKYLDLFTEIATGSAGKKATKQAAKSIASGVAEGAVRNVFGDVVPTRASVHQKISDEVRGVPALGDVIDIGQKASYAMHLGRMFGARKKKKKDDK